MAERERKKNLSKEVRRCHGFSLPCFGGQKACQSCVAAGPAGCRRGSWLGTAPFAEPGLQTSLSAACSFFLQEKEKLKKEKDEAEAKYKYALVDGRQEMVRSSRCAQLRCCRAAASAARGLPSAASPAGDPRLPSFSTPGCLLQVGNFRVEPPGLFRGRGEHPKMGKIKVGWAVRLCCAERVWPGVPVAEVSM